MNEAIPGVTVSLKELVKLRAKTVGLKISGRHKSFAGRSGGHVSVHRGRGLEFDEVRHYQAGDDVRTIDWRVTARRGRTHTKLFREERERPLLIVADLHPGMFFGTKEQFKSVLVSRMAALAAWTASRDGDLVGGVVASHEKCTVIFPRSRRTGVLHLLNELVARQPISPSAATHNMLHESLLKLSRIAHPGSTIMVLSDFAGLNKEGERILLNLSQRSEVMACFIYDPMELTPPSAGNYRFGSLDSQITVDTSSTSLCDSWRLNFLRRLNKVVELSKRSRLSIIEASTTMEAQSVFTRRFPGPAGRPSA
ncbi:MAG: DUF58 domain-containing protein [Desulfobulbaceae bacterium]|nr:DUF58 domain-containing protein [Desulfobulbaceae bacterium]